MKSYFLALLFLVTSTHIGAQQIPSSGLQYRFDYLQKSKKQKKAAIMLSSTGLLLIVVGAIMMANDPGEYNDPSNNNLSSRSIVLFCTGSALTLASIPLHISHKKNERKGVGLSFQHKPSFEPIHESFTSNILPSITLKLTL